MVNPVVFRPRLEIGKIVARSFTLALGNAALLVPIAVAFEVLRQALDWLLQGKNPLIAMASAVKGPGAHESPIDALLQLPGDLIHGIATAAMVWIAYSTLACRPTSLADVSAAVGRNVIAIALVQLAGAALWAVGDAIEGTMNVVPGLVMLAWLIVAVYVLLCWWVAIPAAIVENRGAFSALRRSADLTRGQRGAIVGISAVIALIFLVPAGAVWFASGLGFPQDAQIALLSPLGLAATVLEIVALILAATSTAAIYADLRVFKDGAAPPAQPFA